MLNDLPPVNDPYIKLPRYKVDTNYSKEENERADDRIDEIKKQFNINK
jgi:hypothetical protein